MGRIVIISATAPAIQVSLSIFLDRFHERKTQPPSPAAVEEEDHVSVEPQAEDEEHA